MNNLYAREEWVNATEGHGLGESGVFETFTNKRGELFKALQIEYGRCVSKVFVDNEDGKTVAVGWVFQARRKYEDTREPYLLETWVTVHQREPQKTVKYFYEEA
jgi:hypothetical protein